jgi:lysyl-tRNA synthetase class I
MKLVVCFSTGDGYTYSADHVMPVESESEEQLLIDIEAEVMRAVNEHQTLLDRYAENEKAEKQFRSKKGVTTEQVLEWQRHNRLPNFDTAVNLFGHKWDLTHFYSSESNQMYNISIQTLEAWFTENLVSVR